MMPSTNPKTNWILWGVVLGAALGVRLGAGAWWQQRLGAPDAFAFGDSDSYWHLASQLAQGKAFQYGGPEAKAMRMPGYPTMLSLAFLLWGGEPPVVIGRAVGAVAGVAAVAGAMWIAARQFDRPAGWCAGTLATIYPGGVATSVFILSEALFCPLMVLQAGCWIGAVTSESQRKTIIWSVAAGLASAAAVYARPSWLLFPIFLMLFGAVIDRQRAWQHARVGLIAIALMCVCMTPWWARSYRYTGHFVLTTLEMGASLYDGLNPNADGGSNMDFKRGFYLLQEREEPDVKDGQFAYRVDQRMRSAAWQWARENPSEAVRLAGVKLMRLWSPWPNAGQFRSTTMRLLVAVGFLPLLAAAAVAAWKYRDSNWPAIVIIAAPALYISLLHLVFVSSIRYRQPAMLLAAVLAGAILSETCGRHWKARPPATGET